MYIVQSVQAAYVSICSFVLFEQILPTSVCLAFFRSLERLILTFPQFIVKLNPLLSCKFAEIAMKRLFLLAQGGNEDIMRPEPTLVYVMQYNLDILIIVVVTRKIKQVLGLKCINRSSIHDWGFSYNEFEDKYEIMYYASTC